MKTQSGGWLHRVQKFVVLVYFHAIRDVKNFINNKPESSSCTNTIHTLAILAGQWVREAWVRVREASGIGTLFALMVQFVASWCKKYPS